MEEQTKQFFTKKNIISFLVIGILLLSIPFGVRLALEQTQLRSRAAGNEITFVTGDTVACTTTNGKETCTTTSDTVPVELRSPFGPPGSPIATPTPTGTPQDVQQGWVRDCKLTPASAGDPNITSSCLPWELKSFGSAAPYGPFNSVTGVFYMNNNKPTVRSLLLNVDGKTLNSTTREVTVPSKDAADYRLLFSGTPSYTGGRFGISGEGDTVFFNDLNEFNFIGSDGKEYVHQTAVVKGGSEAWIRDCQLTPPNITSNCLGWEYRNSFGSASKFGPFKSVTGIFYKLNGVPMVRSLFLKEDGKTLKAVTRQVTPSYPIVYYGATDADYKDDGSFNGIPGVGDTVFFNSLDEFKYIGADGAEYIHQSAVVAPIGLSSNLSVTAQRGAKSDRTYSVAKGTVLTFTVNATSTGKALTKGWLEVIKTDKSAAPCGGAVGGTYRPDNLWCVLNNTSLSGFSGTFTGTWTPNAAGEYYVISDLFNSPNPTYDSGAGCTSAPWCVFGTGNCKDNMWTYKSCGNEGYIKVIVNDGIIR